MNKRLIKDVLELAKRHTQAFGYVVTVIIPLIFRSGRRPVIFSRLTGMGDIICTVPAALELKKRHPGGVFIYNCHRDFATIPKLTLLADHVTSLGPIGLVGHWYSFLLGGFYHFAHGDDTSGKVAQEPMVTEFLRQYNLPISEEHPELPVTVTAREKVASILAQKNLSPEDLILIHPGPSWPVREWPLAGWTQLIAALRERGYVNIGQLGVGRYMNFGKVGVPLIPGTVSLLDTFTVEECIAAIASAKLFIGIDSGLLHIAAGTRTSAVGIFAMTLPEYRFSKNFRRDFVVNRIECAGCEHRLPRLHWITGCPYNIRCMKTLSVTDVLRSCLIKLKPKTSNAAAVPGQNQKSI